MRELLVDVRYAIRTLRKSPGFTAIAVIALALGIGANTAIFSVVHAVLLQPLPFDGADRLVSVISLNSHRAETTGATSYPDFRDFRAQNHTLDYLIAYHDDSWALTGSGREAVSLDIAVASADLFPMLGAKPERGRVFTRKEDDTASGPRLVVIGNRAWAKHFGSDPQIVGRVITLRGVPFTVIGVMPEAFNFPIRNDQWDAWTTFAYSTDLRGPDGKPGQGEERGAHYLTSVGKLKPSVSIERAKADIRVIIANQAKQFPNSNKYRDIRIVSALDDLVRNTKPALLLLVGAVGCVLLVACANVANLLLARASARKRELALRTALGASRLRVIRQVLTESVLLSLLGGVVGLAAGAWGSALLVHFSPGDVPRLGRVSMNWVVFAFTFGVSLLTGVAFGIVPALRASQSDPADSLKDGSRGSTEGIRTNKARSLLIVSEIALAVMLLASAGVLLRSLQLLNEVDPGFNPHNVLTGTIAFPPGRYDDAGISRAVESLKKKLQSEPGIVVASSVSILPLSGNDMNTNYEIQGQPKPEAEQPLTRVNVASPDYFQVMGTPILSGRDFKAADIVTSPEVVIVNDAFAHAAFGKENPIGKRVKPGIWRDQKSPWREIVGVVKSAQQDRIGQQELPEVFLPEQQLPLRYTVLIARTRVAPRSLAPAFRTAMQQIDSDLPIDDLKTMDESVATSLAQPRFEAFLLVIFACLALVLTSVGLYGVISYSVSRRTQEIGTRVALGARRTDILRLVMGQGLLLTAAGLAIGLIGSFAMVRWMQSMLFHVGAGDPLTVCAIVLLIGAVSLLACYVPARRAATIEPMLALRYE